MTEHPTVPATSPYEACIKLADAEHDRQVKIIEAATNDKALSDTGRAKIREIAHEAAVTAHRIARAIRDVAERSPQPSSPAQGAERWYCVDEKGNDNFATSIYESGDKGLLVARCNQNGQYPWQGPAIIRGLEANKGPLAKRPVAFRVPRLLGDMVSHYFVTTSEDEARAMADTNQVEYEGLYLVADRSSQAAAPTQGATAWRVWWVSLNTSRTALFEDHEAAAQKALETGGCVIPLYNAASRSPAGCGTPGCTDPNCNYANEPAPDWKQDQAETSRLPPERTAIALAAQRLAEQVPAGCEDPDDLIGRLRNPMWAHSNAPFESPQLEKEENVAAMKEAASYIEELEAQLDAFGEVTPQQYKKELAQARAQVESAVLWCCHVRGPDDVYAAPDYETALAWADATNEMNWSANSHLKIGDPKSFKDCLLKAVPAPWPHSREAHAENLPRSIAGFAAPSEGK